MHAEYEPERAPNDVEETQQQMWGRRTRSSAMTSQTPRRVTIKAAGRLVLAAALLAPALSPQDPGALAERVLASRDYQPALPPVRGAANGDGVARSRSAVADGDPREGTRPAGGLRLGDRVEGVELILLALVVGVGLVVLLAMLRRGRRGEQDVTVRTAQSGPPGAPTPATVTDPLEAARRLWAADRRAEALRELLRGAIDAPGTARWLTARAVLRRTELEGGARLALAELVGAVERSVFALRPPGPTDFERCVSAFRVVRGNATGTGSEA